MSETSKKPRKPRKPQPHKVEVPEMDKNQTEKKKPVNGLAAVAIILLLLASRFGLNGLGTGLGFVPGGQSMQGQPVEESGVITGTSAQETAESIEETIPNSSFEEETSKVEEVTIIEVTVNEDGYLFQNQKYNLEDLFANINEGDEIHYIVQRGSKDDVDDLVDMAKEKGISIIKDN